MKNKILNDIFLVVTFALTFVVLKKTFSGLAEANLSGMAHQVQEFFRSIPNPFTGITTEHDKNENDKIYWAPTRKITWEDIKGTPDPNSPLGAVTYCSIGYSAKLKADTLAVNVTCFFNKQKSWVKENQKTEQLLKHEQGHFDLNEIYSRKLRKQLFEYKFDKTAIKRDLQILYERAWKECFAQQELYDRETENSRNLVKQAEWEKKINQTLRELDVFKNSSIAIQVK